MKPICILAVWWCAVPAGSLAETDAALCHQKLQQALESKNPDTRKIAVVALSLEAEDKALLDTFSGMLNDKDVQVRIATVSSLSEIKTKDATAQLRKALRDPVPEVSFAAAKALYARGEAEGRDALLAVLEKESKPSSGFFSKQMRDALRMMHTPSATFFYVLRQGLGFVPLPGFGEGVASMQALLSDPSTSGRASAALLLGKDKDPATIDGLKDALYDKDWRVRAAAVHSLALRNDPTVKPDMAVLVQDDKNEVALRAAAGWLRLTSIQARPRPHPRRK